MINTRDPEALIPPARSRYYAFKEGCQAQGLDFITTSTFRDNESQNALYAQGRTAPGKIITNAKAGESFHNYRCAFDIVPLRNGKPVWGTTGEDLVLWKKIAAVAKAHGLEWAAEWKTFKEFCHFQYTGGLTLADLKAGKIPT